MNDRTELTLEQLAAAADVPLRTARTVVGLLPLCAPLAQHGNRTAVSDVAAAAILIRAAVPAWKK